MAKKKKISAHPVQFYKTLIRRHWRWRIRANNGKIIAASSEGYKNFEDCEYNARSTAKSIYKHFRK